MDANDTQWVVRPSTKEFKAYRWTGNRADLIHSPDWLRSLVNNWEFESMGDFQFRYALELSYKLFYNGENCVRSIYAAPGDFILLSSDRLIVLDDSAFKAIFMEDDREESV